MLSGYYIMRLLEAAGLPPGVINFVPGDAAQISSIAARLAATSPASTSPAAPAVFNSMWKTVGENIGRYRVYPRLVGETGGKDFIVAHPSADRAGAGRGDRRAAASSIRARSARRRAASTCRSRSGPRCATASSR